MALQVDLYFDAEDMQTLMDSSPDGVLVTCVSVPLSTSSPTLVALAIATDATGSPMAAILGCPTPCKPGGNPTGTNNCPGDSASLLQQLKTQITNPLGFLNSL